MSRLLHRVEDSVLVGALVSMLSMALLQILLRNLFDAGVLWAEPALRVLVLWVAMLGAMVATREGNHIKIDVVSRFLPPATQAGVAFLTSLVSAAVCAVVAWYSLTLVMFEYDDQTIAFGIVPTWVCQAILPLGFSIMALRFLVAGTTRLVARSTG